MVFLNGKENKTREREGITWHGGTKPKAHNLATRAPRWHESGRSRRGRGWEDIGEGTHDVQATSQEAGGAAQPDHTFELVDPAAATFLPSPQLRPKELPSRLRFHSVRALLYP